MKQKDTVALDQSDISNRLPLLSVDYPPPDDKSISITCTYMAHLATN